MSGLLDGLEVQTAEFELPNGNKVKLQALSIFERIEIQQKLSEANEAGGSGKEPIFKEAISMSAVDDDGKPLFTAKELRMLPRLGNGRVVLKMFTKIMEISGAQEDDQESAKKK